MLISFDSRPILVLEIEAMVWPSHLSRSAINFEALEHVAHLFFEVTELVSILVILIAIKPAPHPELGSEVALPGTL